MKYKDINLYSLNFNKKWSSHNLYDLAEWINGRAFKNKDYSLAGIPVIKIAELNNGISSNTQFSKDIENKYYIQKGDILFAWSGNPDTSIDTHKFKFKEGYLNQHIFKVIPKDIIVNEDFFYYLMKYLNKNFCEIARNKQTTGLGHVTKSDLQKFTVRIPNKYIQEKITFNLLNLDQKIEINNKIIDNLEAQAQAIFKSWFVDFEPFQDGEFVESELGLIPKGFKVIKLGDLYPIKSGYAFKSKDWSENGVPIIKIKNIDSGTVDFSDADYIDDKSVLESASNFEVNGKEIVMALTGATTGKFGVIPLGTNAYVNQRVGLFFDKLQIGYGILYGILNQKNMIKNIIELSQGSAQSNLSPNDVNNIKIAYSEECEDISELLNYFLENISITLFQNKKLAELRDALLPKLMSGEIDVSNIDILGEEVRDE